MVGSDKSGEVRIGTSGFHYAGWWGPFYPEDVRKKDALSYYATRFATTELNAPFYRMPKEKVVRNWFEATPHGFRFAWKASRYITHMKLLLVEDQSLDYLESRIGFLGHKLGPILFQFPPRFGINRDRLAGFLKRLARGHRYGFEFRNESWYAPEIFKLLGEYDASLCLSDHAAAPSPRVATASWVYVRNHGPSGEYHGNYSDEALKSWARDIARWRHEGRDVWCFFDNDVKSAAPADAERLIGLVEKEDAGFSARQRRETG